MHSVYVSSSQTVSVSIAMLSRPLIGAYSSVHIRLVKTTAAKFTNYNNLINEKIISKNRAISLYAAIRRVCENIMRDKFDALWSLNKKFARLLFISLVRSSVWQYYILSSTILKFYNYLEHWRNIYIKLHTHIFLKIHYSTFIDKIYVIYESLKCKFYLW